MNFPIDNTEKSDDIFNKCFTKEAELQLADARVLDKLGGLENKELIKLQNGFMARCAQQGVPSTIIASNRPTQFAGILGIWNDLIIFHCIVAYDQGIATLDELKDYIGRDVLVDDSDEAMLNYMASKKKNIGPLVKGVGQLKKNECDCPNCQAMRAEKNTDDPHGLEALLKNKQKKDCN